jgi:hypothetical protein
MAMHILPVGDWLDETHILVWGQVIWSGGRAFVSPPLIRELFPYLSTFDRKVENPSSSQNLRFADWMVVANCYRPRDGTCKSLDWAIWVWIVLLAKCFDWRIICNQL